MKNRPFFVVLFLLFLFSSKAYGLDIYIAPNGSDSNPGTESAPLQSLEGARDKVRTLAKNQTIRVLFKAGTYRFSNPVAFNANDSGTPTNPIVYSSAPGETAFFDGGVAVDMSQFSLVSGSLADRLAPQARGNVWSQVITDSTQRALLSQSRNGLTYNNALFRPTRSPNNGYFNISREFSAGHVMIHENTEFSLLKRDHKITGQGELHGYVRRQYQPYTIPVKRFAGAGSAVIELNDGGFPGIKGDLSAGPRVRIRNLLPTLDVPREWFFDKNDSRLYIYPPGGNIRPDDKLIIWGGNGAIDVNGASNVFFDRIVFQNFAAVDPELRKFNSVVSFDRGSNLRLRGCTLRHIAIPLAPFSILHRARNSLVDSCDIYDNGRGSRLSGGGLNTNDLQVGGNVVSNSHFTRAESQYQGSAISLRGNGNRFTRNLVHNTAKQAIHVSGTDHLLDLNEIFNVNQDEGDGGAIYIGANLVSHGNRFNRNLIHHNIGVPGLIPRAGIYFDDFDAGNTAQENILYKGGAFGIYSNKGTANTAQRNIVMKSFSGIRSGGGGTPAYDLSMQYLDSVGGRTPTTAIKENYVGNMLKIAGRPGWESRVNSNNWINEIDEFWTTRYPPFGFSMNKYFAQKKMIPFETRIYDNFFAQNTENVQAPPGSAERNNVNINLGAMEDPEGSLNFRWLPGQRPAGSPDTNSFDPGLTISTFRKSIPDRVSYRTKVARKFSGIPAYVNRAPYNRNLANRNLYNSGRDVIGASQAGLQVSEADAALNATGSTSSGGSCDVPFESAGVFINEETKTWSSGLIDISCVSGVNIMMQAQGVGPMENADYLNIYYVLNDGSRRVISQNTNRFAQKTVSAGSLSGNTLEIIVEGKTSWRDETYTVSTISVTEN